MPDIQLAKSRAIDIRNQFGLGQRPIADIFTLVEDAGMFLFKKPIRNSNLSAIFMKDKTNHIVIINTNRTLGHQVFSVAHELYHYYYDKELLSGICSANSVKPHSDKEIMADLFASHFLMPDDGVISVAQKRADKNGKLSVYDAVAIQQYFGVSWYAMLMKLEKLGYIDSIHQHLKVGIRRLTKLLEYNTRLVDKTEETQVSKKYLQIVLKCLENDEISETKAAEYFKDVDLNLFQLQKDSICEVEAVED